MYAMRFLLIFLTTIGWIQAQCPVHIQDPCSCSSTRYESVSIVCDKGQSLAAVLLAIGHSHLPIDSLVISSTPVDQIPDYAFQGFRIKKLILRNNGLRFIHSDAFGGTLEETLEELEIRGNYIDSIPQSGVPKLKNLRVLSLSDNLIDYVPDNAFLSYYSRESIRRLDLSSNNMTTIHPTGLLGLENLNQLSLDKNLFQDIPSAALSNVPSIEDLSLGVNLLVSVPPDSLPLPHLKSLSLEVNQIRSIPADSFQSTPSLTYLYLGNNLLTAIDASTFFFINNLKVLSMGNNKDITSITQNALQNLPQLIRLELSDCSITNIEPGAFQKVNKIQVVVLARNHITHVPHDTFSNLPTIVNIDLSGNSITHVDDFSFSQLPSLTNLDLSGNRLESLPLNCLYESLLPKGPAQQRYLLLHNNPWRCDNEMSWLRRWLRDNGDVTITALGGHTARCWTPAHLNGLDLRQTDPVRSKAASQESSKTEQRRKLMKPTSSYMGQMRPEPETVKEDPKIAGGSLALMITALILGIVFLCIILIFFIRYLFRKENEKETHSTNFSSSSVSSGFGSSAYSGAGMIPDHPQRSSTNHNVYLNRPKYWWF